MIIQIYEIQTPAEAEAMIELGVDHIGSVILSETDWKIPELKETLTFIRSSPAKSSLIPLFNSLNTVLRALDYYQPDIVHFCEALTDPRHFRSECRRLVALQQEIKRRFASVQIMRSIPIAQAGSNMSLPTQEISAIFEPYSDYFLTDTVLAVQSKTLEECQPVQGFVGITGEACRWDKAADLVATSRLPVILAGGLSPANVAEAVMKVRPAGVDSCTLTNAHDENGSPIRFKKDLGKVKLLIDNVRQAEQELLGSEVQGFNDSGS